MTNQREDAQSGLWDLEVEDPELEAACAFLNRSDVKETLRKANEASTLRREKVKALEARLIEKVTEPIFEASGARVRAGEYVLTVKRRSGGGFEVPQWDSVGVTSVTGAATVDG